MTITATEAIKNLALMHGVPDRGIIAVTPRLWQELWHEQNDANRKNGCDVTLGAIVLMCGGYRVIAKDKGYDIDALNRAEDPEDHVSLGIYTRGADVH